ncbi:MAG TPA: ribokinase [Acidobacteriota bacterium]|nr:ribokinase [Acidobacteriota bacterium]
MKKARIVVVGSSNTDMVVKSARIPGPGETVLGGEFVMAAGGKGANQAVAAARLGADVTLVARVGDDLFGERAIAGFRQEKIVADYIVKDPNKPSGVALIMVDDHGENIISVAPGANAELSPEDVQKARPAIEQADVVLIQLEIPLPAVHEAARLGEQSGARVILNPAPAQPLDDTLISCVDIITPNETEAEILTGIRPDSQEQLRKAAEELLRRGVNTVVITMGGKGSFLVSGEETGMVPTVPIRPVDTTAAGDAFNAALAIALAEGRGLRESISFANRAGALTATRLGAQPSLPTRAELDAFA